MGITQKHYVLGRSVLLKDPNAIKTLRNGAENIVYISSAVVRYLDHAQADPVTGYKARIALDSIFNDDKVVLLPPVSVGIYTEAKSIADGTAIYVSSNLASLVAAKAIGVNAQEYLDLSPYQSESQKYTGVVGYDDEKIPNSFEWVAGKPVLHKPSGDRVLNHNNIIWKVQAKTAQQNMAMELMLDPDIDLVTLQSEAGYGKSYLALATAVQLVLSKETNDLYKKIFIVNPCADAGESMGFLPGNVDEKMGPYVAYIKDLLLKLRTLRPCNRLFLEGTNDLDPKKIEILPLNFLQGKNIENAVVIFDECQNTTRGQARTVLTRMCSNVKCFCTGDTHQVQPSYLSEENNGLNWIVTYMKGAPRYAHIVLKGAGCSRGPITNMVLASGL